jgi:CxxC-x17-CxxC domain-containing protein
MKDFKKSGKFGGKPGGNKFGKKSFGKPSFGGGERGGRGGDRVQLFDATCAKCGNACQVPFRPTGERPVFCRDCFNGGKRQTAPDGRESRSNNFERREIAPIQSSFNRPQERDTRIDDLKRQIETMNTKLDTIVRMMTSPQRTTAPAPEPAKSDIQEKPAKSSAKKKPAAKKKK